jgi:hypothetical protein
MWDLYKGFRRVDIIAQIADCVWEVFGAEPSDETTRHDETIWHVEPIYAHMWKRRSCIFLPKISRHV